MIGTHHKHPTHGPSHTRPKCKHHPHFQAILLHLFTFLAHRHHYDALNYLSLHNSLTQFTLLSYTQPDYPISPTLFHWESQNNASPDTPTGRRYVEQSKRGTNVILFVRERKRDDRGETLPYHCLGRARYRSHESERPMKILWELERPMPGWLYQAGKVVAG